MQAIPMPSIGDRIRVDFPTSNSPSDPSGRYIVADIDGADNITALPLGFSPPAMRAGSPCLVEYRRGQRRVNVGAITLNSGPGGVVMQLHTLDQRRFPRFRRPIALTIEVPHTTLGVIDGVTEDVSLGGLRAHVPVAVPTDRRAFVSLGVATADPILAVARTLSCNPVGARATHVVRVQFTVISAQDQARLFALLDWPVSEPSTGPRSSLRSQVHSGRMSAAAPVTA
jgi:hypothetical protein